MSVRAKIICAVLIALAIAAGSVAGYRWWESRQAKTDLKKADQLQVQQAAIGTQAVTHEQAESALKPTLQADAAAVAQASEAVAKHQYSAPQPSPGPNQPATTPQPVQAPVDVAALDAAKDTLIEALKKANADLTTALADALAGDEDRQAQVKALQGEVAQLRAAIAAMPKDLKWSAGAVAGASVDGSSSKGVYLDRNLSVLRVGVEVTQNSYSFASRQGWETRIRLGFNF